MKLKSLFIVFVFTLFVGITNIYSQEVQFGLDFQVGVPQGEFSDQLEDRWGVGVGGMFGYRFPSTPFMLGVDLGFMNFGTDTRQERWSTTIPDATVDVENSYNLVHGDALFRIIPSERVIRPYIEGLVGFNYFFTETKIRDRGSTDPDDTIASDTNFKDTTLSYGFGGGLQFRVYSDDGTGNNNDDNGNTMPYSVYLTLSGRYMVGNEAEYLRQGSIEIVNGQAIYDVQQSTTDLMHFKIGISVSL